MELPGSHYFYTLALISITFAGFAALVAAFRQMIGGRMSDFDVFVIRTTLLRSFIVAGCSMLPTLLALYELPHSIIWRVSSLVTAVLLILFTLTAYAIRRAVATIPISRAFFVNSFLQIVITLYLLIIAQGTILKPAAGPFAVAVTAIMVVAVIAYVASLQLLLQGHPKERGRRSTR